ncbi:CRISPR-associated exonuclease Cas4 [Thermoactinomyces sp. DSM 45891]|uniref:CRISPR-associated protein Cas4 n=1 Tax=Thermoactinomyces sp. DSM 45891 TaxID=1761907 RepID=UPI000922B45C|nr:CRISPR-associated protein Cas4 [Thermoactinomyces sp. DSM 45891]SFX78606.1 CRISPR-associated exonuclease Cas4 [Thermoactinomyces sp. DSM 45891]
MREEDIGGQHFYYLESCFRQLWLYAKGIRFEEGFEDVELGRLYHEESYERNRKEIRVDGIVIDFIKKDGYIHETKSSKVVKKEHETQPLYYAYVLKYRKQFNNIKGAKIHYPAIKEIITLDLTEDRVEEIEKKIQAILENVQRADIPPVHSNKKLCKKCAYFEFCYV